MRAPRDRAVDSIGAKLGHRQRDVPSARVSVLDGSFRLAILGLEKVEHRDEIVNFVRRIVVRCSVGT